MDNKLNIEQIGNYSEQVAEVLSKSFFIWKEKISGEEILNLCTIKQVNLFTLKILFQEWKNEAKKLESPYFDYEHIEVIEGIETFKNIVSRHILVEKSIFQPILTQAIVDTLMLICSPYHYYLHQLDNANQRGIEAVEMLNENKKFTKINTTILDGLIANLEKSGSTIERRNLGKVLDEVVEKLSSGPEDMEPYVAAFSNYAPFDINKIYLEVERSNTAKRPEENETIVERSINDNTHTVKSTLNEALARENQTSLADLHEQQKIKSISKGITLNQRFMFVNVLFDGNVAKFNNTVLELDRLKTLAEAEKYLSVYFRQWSNESQEVGEFMNILRRRFS